MSKMIYVITVILLAFSVPTNGESFAIGTTNGNIYLWDAIGNKVVSTLTGHTASVKVLRRLNESHIVSGGADNTVRVWDVSSSTLTETIQPVATLSFHKDWVQDVQIAQNGSMIVSASDDGTIKFLDAENGTLVETIRVSHLVLSISLIKNETLLVAGCSDSVIRVYNLTKNNELEFSIETSTTTTTTTSPIQRVDFLEDIDYLVAGSADGRISVYDISNTTNITLVKSIKDFFSSNLISLRVIKWQSANYVISSDSRGIVRIWTLRRDEFQLKFTLQSESNGSLYVDTDNTGDRLIGVSFDLLLNVWQLSGENKMINSLKIDLKQAGSAYIGIYTFLKLKSDVSSLLQPAMSSAAAKKKEEKAALEESVRSASEPLEVIFGMENNSLVIWDLIGNKSKQILNGHQTPISVIKLVKNSALLVSGDTKSIIVWNLTSNNSIIECVLNAHTNTISFLDELSSDLIVSAAYDGLIKFWDLTRCELSDSIYIGSPIYHAKRFDDKYLALATSDSTLKIYDLERDKILFNINMANSVYDIESTTDYLITGPLGNCIQIWNKTDWRVVYTWPNNTMLAISMIVNKIDNVDHMTVIDQLGSMYVFCLRNLTLVHTLVGYSNIVPVQLFHLFNADPGEARFLSRSMSGLVKVWPVSHHRLSGSEAKPREYDLTGVISTDSTTVNAVIYFNRTRFESTANKNTQEVEQTREAASSINILLSINPGQLRSFAYGKIPAYRFHMPLNGKKLN